MAEWINESNSYIENMNLFTVAMGEAAQGAYDYAVQVNKSPWNRYFRVDSKPRCL